MNKTLIILLHLVGWAFFISLPFVIGMPSEEHIKPILLKHSLITLFFIVFFYTNIYWLIPVFFSKKNYVIYIGIVVILFVLLILLNIGLDMILEIEDFPKPSLRKINDHNILSRHIGPSIILLVFIFAVSSSYKIISEWSENEKKRKELENEKLTYELSFLRSQVNPHFLFNTLNNIYSLALTNSEYTPEAVMKLSQLLRYMIYETNEEFVSLKKELNYLQDYIDLQRLRITENVSLSFMVTDDSVNCKIEPMLLIPFIENAFKHGIDYSKKSWISIHIDIWSNGKNNHLKLQVENSLFDKKETDKNSGIGLDNVKKRIAHLYPDMHHLDISRTDNSFSVILELIII